MSQALKEMTEDMDGFIGDDYPPERIAHDAAEAGKEAMEACTFTARELLVLRQAEQIYRDKAST